MPTTPGADVPKIDEEAVTGERVSTHISVIDLTASEAVIDLRATSPSDRYREAREDAGMLLRDLAAELPGEAFDEGNGVVGVLAGGQSRYGDVVRATELAMGWGDMPTYMDGYEHASVFFLWFDNARDGMRELVHCGRLLRGSMLPPPSSGSQVIDHAMPDVTIESVCEYHQIPDIRQCWDIVSSMSLNRRSVTRTPYGLLSFRMGLDLLAANDAPKTFSWINPLTERSFRRLSMPATKLCGRTVAAPQIDGYEYNAGFFAGCQDVVASRAGLMNTRHTSGSYVATARDWPMSLVTLDNSIMSEAMAGRLDA